MNTDELIQNIYEDNFSHVDFMENMGGDCDCNIHQVLEFLADYLGIKENA